LPDHIALAAAELSQALVLEETVLADKSFVSGTTVSTRILEEVHEDEADWMKLLPAGYKFKSWEEYVKEEDWSAML
jgi:hypothetical protein